MIKAGLSDGHFKMMGLDPPDREVWEECTLADWGSQSTLFIKFKPGVGPEYCSDRVIASFNVGLGNWFVDNGTKFIIDSILTPDMFMILRSKPPEFELPGIAPPQRADPVHVRYAIPETLVNAGTATAFPTEFVAAAYANTAMPTHDQGTTGFTTYYNVREALDATSRFIEELNRADNTIRNVVGGNHT
jgi:hypothetical protein